MCGRFTQTAGQKALLNRFLVKVFNEEIEQQLRPRYNIAPTQDVPVIRCGESAHSRKLCLMRWGLIPSWAKEPKFKFNTINARAEGLKSSPVYREPFRRTRCLVPASGFFEWKSGSSPKQPYYIYPAEPEEQFAFAGLWDRWVGPDGSGIDSFTIVTTEANELMAGIHHRMPVIIAEADQSAWLGEADDGKPDALLRPFPSENMTMHPVSRLVNKVANDVPEVLQTYEEQEWDF